ncbi:hypothetical protein D9758_000934 [Tetrapyrgos nigripes]|uniref:MFS general substrate transporter n=1 Tax=Tetrapyrgos nigripes TaxID=182062 RepID=A0A8H5LY84_9AGAR|nr:hypothetical protein D9758_000934 [Tetrapyrgos nigripes]
MISELVCAQPVNYLRHLWSDNNRCNLQLRKVALMSCSEENLELVELGRVVQESDSAHRRVQNSPSIANNFTPSASKSSVGDGLANRVEEFSTSESANALQEGTSASIIELDEPADAVSLPPVDRGFHAYAYLASAFFVELLVWSLPLSYGVFLNYYSTHTFPQASQSILAAVGSISSGLMYLSSPVVLPLLNRFPWYKRKAMLVGLFLCLGGLLGAAFAREPWQLILTQGVIYAIGGSLLYFPTMTYTFEWFSERKGLANGVIFSGTSIGGVLTPIIAQALLDRYGPRTTLIAWAVGTLVTVAPCLPYLKGRLPVAQAVNTRSLDLRLLYQSAFWILFVANLFQALGSFFPSLYIPTFASDIHLSATSGTLAIAFMNGVSAPGLVFFGWLSDRHLSWSILLISLTSALSVFLLWGLAITIGPLLAFSCVYGFTTLSWPALWSRFVTASATDDPFQASSLMAFFVAGKGLGSVLSAPIASGLMHPWYFTNKANSGAYGVQGYVRPSDNVYRNDVVIEFFGFRISSRREGGLTD